jgi:hypothetical protein
MPDGGVHRCLVLRHTAYLGSGAACCG